MRIWRAREQWPSSLCAQVHNEIFELPYSGVSIGWGWGRTMEITWPAMPWDAANDVSYNDIHDVMQMLGDGGSIYTLGPQGNVPFPKGPSGKVYPATPTVPLKRLPASQMVGNYIHDTGPRDGVVDAPGAGSHFPGGLYNDEGTTNWAMVGNVVSFWIIRQDSHGRRAENHVRLGSHRRRLLLPGRRHGSLAARLSVRGWLDWAHEPDWELYRLR